MKTLAIVTDFTLNEWQGGAALVNQYIAKFAISRGWNIEFIRINPTLDEWKEIQHSEIDAYLITNIPYMPISYLNQLIDSRKRYVVFRHDIASICYLDPVEINSTHSFLKILFEKSTANFFISPIQYKYYERVAKLANSYIIPPPLDLLNFNNYQLNNRHGDLYIGEISIIRGVEKSVEEMRKNNAKKSFYGQLIDKSLLENINNIGGDLFEVVTHSEIPEILNKHSFFYYHPQIIDAFCLKVLEAELCGMSLNVRKENIGRFYFEATAIELRDFMREESPNLILSKIDL